MSKYEKLKIWHRAGQNSYKISYKRFNEFTKINLYYGDHNFYSKFKNKCCVI